MQSPLPLPSMPADAFGGAAWRKSSHSQGGGGDCVELTAVPGLVGVRDSKNAAGPNLAFSKKAFQRFTAKMKECSYDL